MSGMDCHQNLSRKTVQVCEDIKQCPDVSRREAIVGLIFSGLVKKGELQLAFEEVKRQMMWISRRQSYISDGEKWRHMKNAKSAILESIAEIDSLLPWIKGRFFKRKLHEIKKAIESGEKDEMVKRKIEKVLIHQSLSNRRELLRLYDRFVEAGNCLNEKGRCDRFFNILEMTPPALPAKHLRGEFTVDALVGHRQFEVFQCMEQEVARAKVYNQILQSAGEITLGLSVGLAGGIYGLGVNAIRIVRNGQRIKGGLSWLGLGGLGWVGYKHSNVLIATCKQASQHLTEMGEFSSDGMCSSENYPQNIEKYFNCLLDLGLTAAAFIPASLNLGVREAKAKIPKRERSQSDFKNITNKYDLENYKISLEMEQRNNFLSLLDEFDYGNLRTVQPWVDLANREPDKLSLVHRALRYSRTLSGKKREQFIQHMDDIILKGEVQTVRNPQVRKFLKKEEKHKKRVNILEKKYEEELVKKRLPSHSARELALKRSQYIDDVKMGCRSRNINAIHARSISLFQKVTVGLTGTGLVMGFANANWHLPKDTRWFGRLGYELVLAVMYTKVLVKVMKNPASTTFKRYLQFNLGSIMVEGVDSIIYAQIFGLSEDEARDEINRILKSPEKKQALEELSAYLDESGFVDHFKKLTVSNFRKMFTNHQENHSLEVDVPEGFENLQDEDFAKPEVQDRIIEAVMAQYYDSERGQFNMGGKGLDRFTYERIWNTMVHAPKDVLLAIPLYYSLCLTAAYPVRGFLAAAGIQTANQILSAGWYFKMRSNLINQ